MDTALVLIDLQNCFLHPDGTFGRLGFDVGPLRPVIGACGELAEAARRRGVPVYYVRYAYRPDYGDLGIMREIMPPAVELGGLRDGEWDSELVSEITVHDGDRVLVKNRYSAFHGTGLADELRDRGIGAVVLAGVLSNVCVTGAAQDAMQQDLRVTVVGDASATVDPAVHDAALATVALAYGTVVTTAEQLATWRS